MKSLSTIAKELGVSVAAVSYVYNNKWRENRINPDLAERIRSKFKQEQVVPNPLGRQLQSGRTQTIGVLLPHLDQPYFLKLLAGIEHRLNESDYMILLGSAHWQHQVRQVELAKRMLARRIDALLMCPRPAEDLSEFVASTLRTGETPLVFVDNYLPEFPVSRVLSDNHWGARQAVGEMLNQGRRKVVFLGGNSTVAALRDRYQGYCDALKDAGLRCLKSLTVWRDAGDELALESVRRLFSSDKRPDAILATSFFKFFPFLQVLDDLGLKHPNDVLLAGFDEPMESWVQDVVRSVIQKPLLVVQQDATEMGQAAVDLILMAINGTEIVNQQRLIQPVLSWQQVKWDSGVML